MKKEEFILSGLLEQYALGAVTPEESVIVESFLSQYPDLKKELDLIEVALENYALQNAQIPDSSVKQKLMVNLFSDKNTEEQHSNNAKIGGSSSAVAPVVIENKIHSFYKMASAAMLVLLIGSIAFGYYFYNQNEDTRNKLDLVQQSLDEQQKRNIFLTDNLNIVTDKYTQNVVMKGTPQSPDAIAKIFWMKNTGQVYVDFMNLPAPPSGKQYQLWAIIDGKPVDAGMISSEKAAYSIQKMKSFGKADAFAITLENSGGSPTPTMSEMVVISEM
ncbi:MAG: anti-sigma factor [Ginsengibacter sp.]